MEAAVDDLIAHEGLHEGINRSDIAQYLKSGGQGMDPKKQAWCAATVNAAMARQGFARHGFRRRRKLHGLGEWSISRGIAQGRCIRCTRLKLDHGNGGKAYRICDRTDDQIWHDSDDRRKRQTGSQEKSMTRAEFILGARLRVRSLRAPQVPELG